ncbi:MAG: GAF domain-containing protein [Planctomycetes bacterium]|nr:GAF domain-containing protein [Planctomycetota bacterium]
MPQIPLPPDEPKRLAALQALRVLYTPSEERFDRITRVAVRALDVPVALVTLVAEGCQWFKSCQGIDARETPRDVSFCAYTILGDDALVVPDTLVDPRFQGNPMVTGEPFITAG